MPGLEIDLNLYRTEAELVEALRCGNPDACTCLIKRFASLVYKPAMRILNDADEAEEVLQRTFIKACEKFGSFEERSGLGTWLYRIATNEALMMQRRREDVTMSFIDAESIQPDDVPHSLGSHLDDPASAALSTELRATLEAALLELPESLRLVFVLRDMGGLSTEETAETLGLGGSAVKVRLHRARKRMRELLTEYVTR